MLLRWLMVVSLAFTTASYAYEPRGKTTFVVDQTFGSVLLDHNADQSLPPASMSKLMTLNMLFEALEDGRVALDTKFRVSEKAHKMGGSKMFLREGTRVSVENLIKGIVVQSGNDACIVVAENLAGDEATFAQIMTERAQELGMTNSSFGNATGWPHPKQRMSARDLVFIAHRLITKFPQYYPYFEIEEFAWSDITQSNRNPLLGLGLGVDGLKTGHTNEAGYGLVASAQQGDRRIIFVVSGLTSEAERAEEGERLINWAFRQFSKTSVTKSGEEIAKIPVWMGQKRAVGVASPTDLFALKPSNLKEPPKLSIRYDGPIATPIKKGDKVADLIVSVEGMEKSIHPLVATEDISVGGLIPRMRASFRKLNDALIGFDLQGVY